MAKQPSKKVKKKEERIKLHKSFRRSYREDYKRELEVPGILEHFAETFKIIFKNWKLFGVLLLLIVLSNMLLVGIMSEESYAQFKDILDETSESLGEEQLAVVPKALLLLSSTITTGGLSTSISDVQGVFAVILLLITWLVTIYLLRHIKAGQKVKLKDALYNACTPLISTFLVFLLVVVQCIPILIFVVFYSTAVQTEFLAKPFYALLFFIFSAVMFLLSGYWLSSSLIALVAVSAPGLYPMKAIHTASDLMAGRRIKFILRIVAVILLLLVVWVIIMMPLIMFDIWVKTFEWSEGIPFIPVCLSIMTVFSVIFISTYLYIYYRWMLNYDKD